MSTSEATVEWGHDGRQLVFMASVERDGRPYSYSKGFPLARLRFARDREAEVQAMARETVREMAVDLAQLQATFEARGDDKNPATGRHYGE